MAPCLAIEISELVRSRLCVILGILNWVSILASLVLTALGIYIKFKVSEFTNLVTDYDGKSLPFLLISIGVISASVNAAGGFVIFISANPLRRDQFRHFLLAYIIITLCVCICIFAGGCMCFAHIQHLDKSFQGGIVDAMGRYKEEIHTKVELDQLQMYYSCCGSEKYVDWFHIPWVKENYINIEARGVKAKLLSEGNYKSDDVPFSCCSIRSHRPCIHHHVHDNKYHYNYDYRQATTLNKRGCKEALMNYFGDELLTDGGAVVLSIFFLQLMLAVVARLLQTSIDGALKKSSPLDPAYGYIFDIECGKKPDGEKEDQNSKESLLANQEDQEEQVHFEAGSSRRGTVISAIRQASPSRPSFHHHSPPRSPLHRASRTSHAGEPVYQNLPTLPSPSRGMPMNHHSPQFPSPPPPPPLPPPGGHFHGSEDEWD